MTYHDEGFIFPPYNPIQIDALKEFVSNILQRYLDIMPTDVVGHSDLPLEEKVIQEQLFHGENFIGQVWSMV